MNLVYENFSLKMILSIANSPPDSQRFGEYEVEILLNNVKIPVRKGSQQTLQNAFELNETLQNHTETLRKPNLEPILNYTCPFYKN